MNILRWRRKSKKKIKPKTLLLFIFSLIMTTFAWFAYSEVLNSHLNIHVAAWDMEYFIDDVEYTNPIGINIATLYPTMPEDVITIDIKNNGEALVDIDYHVESITIAGVEYELRTESVDAGEGESGGESGAEAQAEGEETTYYVDVGTPVLETDAETGELYARGDIINDTTRFPFTIKVKHSPQVIAGDQGYLTVTTNWVGDNDELDSEWGYIVGKYFVDNPSATSAMSISLSIDSYQADEEIVGGTGVLPNAPGTKPYLPSSDFTHVEGTDLDTGLIIQDAEGNEYVWIEVPKVFSVYQTAGINLTEFTEDDYTNIETDLKNYTSTYRNGTTYSDQNYEAATGLTDAAYTELKQKMLKSVYQYGGFYIARYEAGADTYRTSHTTISGLTAKSQQNKYPINWVTAAEAQTLASAAVSSGSGRTSSLMFGIQWDLVMKYLETKAVNQGTALDSIKSLLMTNSTTWGNYSSTLYNITNENALWSASDGSTWNAAPYERTSTIAKIYLTTGAATKFARQNIFDLGGNLWEWTLEYAGSSANSSAIRGGSYESTSSENNANYRGYNTTSYYSVGFRVTIY